MDRSPPEGPAPHQAMVHGAEQMAANAKQIQDDTVDGQETLRVCDGGESPHLALALTRRLVRRLRAVVLALSRAVGDGRHEGAVCRGVTAELVRDQAERGQPWPFNSVRKNRAATCRLRRGCTRMSITSPSWSTARQRYCRLP